MPYKDSGLCGTEVDVFGYKFSVGSRHEDRQNGY